jgi:hypothetical protein
MSITRSFTQRQFNANNEHLLAVARCSTALSKFEVVLCKIPRYFKVYTCSIAPPLNTNSWHGSTELNTMTFIFFTFIMSPRLAQNYWSASNCYYSPTSNSDVKTRSSTKSNCHTCTGPVHHILYHPSALLGHLNITQTIGGWEDNLVSHLAGTLSWRWHLRLGGWCIQYPWHTSPASIERSILPPRGQPTPATALHVA